MKRAIYILEFLMPCFCTGANQAKAEVRASSIRGQLRWWFRALGGNSTDERQIFGGVAGTASASALTVRISQVQNLPWSPPRNLDIASDSYVYHFAQVSGTEGNGAVGPRWQSQGALAPKSTFTLELLQRHPLIPGLQSQLDRAIRCFLQLGAIGLRITRGLGSFICHEEPFNEAILVELHQAGFRTELRPEPPTSYDQMAKFIGSLVKGTRKQKGWKIDTMSPRPVSTPSPFGTSANPRQTSATYFRPVRRDPKSSSCQLLVFEAPQERVLGPESRKPSAVGHSRTQLIEPVPASKPGFR